MIKEFKFQTRNNTFKLIEEKRFTEELTNLMLNSKNNRIVIVEEGVFINSCFYLSFGKNEYKD